MSDAKKDFQRAIDLDPEFVAPRLQLGYCMCKLAIQMQSPSIMQEANATLEETTKKFPKSPEAWSLYGQVRFVFRFVSLCHSQKFFKIRR